MPAAGGLCRHKGGPNPLGRRGTWRRVPLMGRLATARRESGLAAEPAALSLRLRTLEQLGSDRSAKQRGNSLLCLFASDNNVLIYRHSSNGKYEEVLMSRSQICWDQAEKIRWNVI